MATKSILKNVTIKDANAARRLVNALEHAEGKRSKRVALSRTVSSAKKEEIRALFGGK